ncbi:YeeE/YedE family protein [Burkholderia gladioli]|uniref:YeeE/YedE family protein n=1 Tax=Burkholderia gladioli TaxID=28095 RepID=UPI00163F69EF|nr:YeeE/YedE family protein [Burkholderia gladioli]
MLILNAFVAGLIFATGLIISGMANPAKVLGFLDIAGNWDPSLAFVMGGAIAVGSIGFAMARRFERSLFNAPISLPSATRIDRRLLAGSTVFGMGWGLAGFCPGPALVSAGGGQFEAMLFVIAMLVGMKLFALAERRAARTQPS